MADKRFIRENERIETKRSLRVYIGRISLRIKTKINPTYRDELGANIQNRPPNITVFIDFRYVDKLERCVFDRKRYAIAEFHYFPVKKY